MKIPTELELLGVQTREDAEILKREYPEWCALTEKPERLKSDENIRHPS